MVVKEVVVRVAFYADRNSTVPDSELRAAVEAALELAADSIAVGTGDGLDLGFARETAARRAREGAPLPEVLRVYRIAFGVLWKDLVDRDRSAVPATSELLDVATVILDLMDQHAVAVTEAYREAGASILKFQQRRRSALVEALLTGHPTPEVGPWEAVSLLGFPHGGRHVVVAADTPRVADEALPEVEEKLASHGLASAWRLAPLQQLGVIALRGESVDAVARVLEAIPGARVGISPVYDTLPETPRALRLAQAALEILPPKRAGVHVFSSSPLAALVVSAPAEGIRLAHRVLGPVLAMAADDRAVMIETLWVYLSRSGSAENAAQFLYCHPNTVRYRLRRLQEMTDRRLSEPREAAELTAAAYVVRLNPSAFSETRSDPNS
ncbi:helix-turn-helix domain-containing protein [Tsukamurella sp. 8F]|uniref:PucR family transcriptional regulator n=1 Tax=unclassified Tsukamurella TaxID=2633480 RepID=UPI0023B9AFD8|nr:MULTISPECIES: PucR family transcriptional regulator [unclassified Tsukamurella]MDF0528593.1 helix-turn-helix domain-containing protein [Tsukamurella sp. 8J]MDF0585555.1 helix-turn-helix domain-containing protein [Tsukamurella sp. 8F]